MQVATRPQSKPQPMVASSQGSPSETLRPLRQIYRLSPETAATPFPQTCVSYHRGELVDRHWSIRPARRGKRNEMPASFETITAGPPADAGASEGGIIISAGEVAQQQEQQEEGDQAKEKATKPTIPRGEEPPQEQEPEQQQETEPTISASEKESRR